MTKRNIIIYALFGILCIQTILTLTAAIIRMLACKYAEGSPSVDQSYTIHHNTKLKIYWIDTWFVYPSPIERNSPTEIDKLYSATTGYLINCHMYPRENISDPNNLHDSGFISFVTSIVVYNAYSDITAAKPKTFPVNDGTLKDGKYCYFYIVYGCRDRLAIDLVQVFLNCLFIGIAAIIIFKKLPTVDKKEVRYYNSLIIILFILIIYTSLIHLPLLVEIITKWPSRAVVINHWSNILQCLIILIATIPVYLTKVSRSHKMIDIAPKILRMHIGRIKAGFGFTFFLFFSIFTILQGINSKYELTMASSNVTIKKELHKDVNLNHGEIYIIPILAQFIFIIYSLFFGTIMASQ